MNTEASRISDWLIAFGSLLIAATFRPTSTGNDAYCSWTAKEAVSVHPAELRTQLAHFTDSSTFTRHALVARILMTEGVVYLAQAAAAHWLTDAIGSYLLDARSQSQPFQVWRLVVDARTARAQLRMTDGNGPAPIIAQQIDYTDFPLPKIELWLVAEGEQWVLMLPTEY